MNRLRLASRAGWVAVAALIAVPLLGGCRSSAKNDPILRLSAAESLAEGHRLFALEKYASARPYFSHAFEIEPNSAAGREALLLVADTLYLEGGTSQLIQAEAKYRDYQNRFPTSDRGAYVQFRIASSLARRIERADRDQAATVKALAAFEDLVRLYPTAPEAESAEEEIRRVRDRLAEHEFMIGHFYLRYKLPGAAIARFEGLLTTYPDFAQRDKVLHFLALAHRKAGRDDDAAAAVARLESDFPQSEWTARAREESR